jgi:hypothetical protein
LSSARPKLVHLPYAIAEAKSHSRGRIGASGHRVIGSLGPRVIG